jgi:hypothetical protein
MKMEGTANLCTYNLFWKVNRVDTVAVEVDVIPGIRSARTRRDDHGYWQREVHTDTFLLVGAGEQIRDALVNGIVHLAGSTVEIPLEDFFLVFGLDPEDKVTLADRAAEDIHE